MRIKTLNNNLIKIALEIGEEKNIKNTNLITLI